MKNFLILILFLTGCKNPYLSGNDNFSSKTFKNKKTFFELHYRYDKDLNQLSALSTSASVFLFIFQDLNTFDVWLYPPQKMKNSENSTVGTPFAAICAGGEGLPRVYSVLSSIFGKNISRIKNKIQVLKGASGYYKHYYLQDDGKQLCLATTGDLLKHVFEYKRQNDILGSFKIDFKATIEAAYTIFDSKSSLGKKLIHKGFTPEHIDKLADKFKKVNKLEILFKKIKKHDFKLSIKTNYNSKFPKYSLKNPAVPFKHAVHASSIGSVYIAKSLLKILKNDEYIGDSKNPFIRLLQYPDDLFAEMFINKKNKAAFYFEAKVPDAVIKDTAQKLKKVFFKDINLNCKIQNETSVSLSVNCIPEPKNVKLLGKSYTVETGITGSKIYIKFDNYSEPTREVTYKSEFSSEMNLFTAYRIMYLTGDSEEMKNIWLKISENYNILVYTDFYTNTKSKVFTIDVTSDFKDLEKLKKEKPRIYKMLKYAVKNNKITNPSAF